jgi:hypothetical protein
MIEGDDDRKLADEVALLKAKAIRHGTHVFRALGAFLVTAVIVGVGTWFSAQPINRDDLHGGLALGLAASTFFVLSLLSRVLCPPPKILCPKCGYDWRGSEPNDDWLTWSCCPGCGLKMSDPGIPPSNA